MICDGCHVTRDTMRQGNQALCVPCFGRRLEAQIIEDSRKHFEKAQAAFGDVLLSINGNERLIAVGNALYLVKPHLAPSLPLLPMPKLTASFVPDKETTKSILEIEAMLRVRLGLDFAKTARVSLDVGAPKIKQIQRLFLRVGGRAMQVRDKRTVSVKMEFTSAPHNEARNEPWRSHKKFEVLA